MAYNGMDDMAGFEEDELDRGSAGTSCELPSASLRRTAFGPDGGDRWECPICPLTDRSARPDRMPPCIAEFREALMSQPRVLPELEACRVLSDMFNRTCYEADHAPGRRSTGVARMTPNDVQRHLHHVRHLPANEDHMLDDCIMYTLDVRKQIERNGLWRKDVDGDAKLDRDMFPNWCKAIDSLKKLVELRHRFHGAFPLRESAGVRKRRTPTRQHFSLVR